ncbi:MAG: decarboxylating 6-phosphogluconate dehydrogenase [Verrucomicrobiae bacterium]|nr:decarboxylating 6-phosphogluconate dehydrogenase [Verrucomicrobiae bacterium]
MKIGLVGLGRMGGGMVRRLIRAGNEVVVFNRDQAKVAAAVKDGAIGSSSLQDLVSKLPSPKFVWLMLPCGDVTETHVNEVSKLLSAGDTIIEGGNSFYKDDARRAIALKEKGIHYVDVGVSGGVWGLERGYCQMIGGPVEQVKTLDPIFKALAPGVGDIKPILEKGTAPEGYLHCGPAGAGHYVKMVHNGIEYGLMEAYGEGFEIMKSAKTGAEKAEHRYDLDVAAISELWRRGSVIPSWLLDLAVIELAKDGELGGFSGKVNDSGEGRWTVNAAVEQAVAADVLTTALYKRFRSRQENTFSEKILSAMRKGFGGHQEPK